MFKRLYWLEWIGLLLFIFTLGASCTPQENAIPADEYGNPLYPLDYPFVETKEITSGSFEITTQFGTATLYENQEYMMNNQHALERIKLELAENTISADDLLELIYPYKAQETINDAKTEDYFNEPPF